MELEHLAMSAGADKYIVAKVTEAVEQPTNKNAQLTAQLSEYMKINLDMAKKLNLKDAQVQDPEVKILAENVMIKAAFERNLDPTGYCWTHGFRVTKRHSSQTCSIPAAGHQSMATRKNILGGSGAGK